MRTSLFDSSILATAQQAVEFVSNILESSTEYSVIGKDLDGKILLWNEGARRMYGYEAEEVVGKLNSDVLHTPEDVATGKPREIMEAALRDGKWEGVIGRVRKDGRRISARVVITPRHDSQGKPIGFLLISKDVSHEIRFAEEIRKTKLFDNAIVGNAKEAVDFIANILESSTEYSIIGKDLDGKILLWNEGARRLYGYEPEEVVGKQTPRSCTPRKTWPPASLANCLMPRCETESGKAPSTGAARTASNSPPAWSSLLAWIPLERPSDSCSFPRTSPMKFA